MPYTSHKLEDLHLPAECRNEKSNYYDIKYDCVPDIQEKQSMCGGVFTGKKGALKSPDYPSFKPNLDCNAKIKVAANKVIKVYITDLNIEQGDE